MHELRTGTPASPVQASADRRRATRHVPGRRSAYLYIAPFFVLFAAFGLFPLLYTAWISLHDVDLGNLDQPTWVGIDNYRDLFANPFFWTALQNTVTIGLLAEIPCLTIALGLAHVLNMKTRGRTFFRVALLVPYATSIAAATLIFGQLYGRDHGLINTAIGVVGIPPVDWEAGRWSSQIAVASIVIWRWVGYNAIIYLAAMQAVPHELYEQAAIDGAGAWHQFRSVTVPALRPTIVFTVVVSTIGVTQIFAEPLLFPGTGNTSGGASHQYQTLGLLMYQQGWSNSRLGQASATAWLMFVFVLLIVVGYWTVSRLVRRARRQEGSE